MTRRTAWLAAAGTILLAGVVLATQEPALRLARKHPEAVRIPSPPTVDSLAFVLARCFRQPEWRVRELRWFVTDSSLGLSDAGGSDPAGARYYAADTAVVVRRVLLNVPQVLDHEIRHHLADPLGRHPVAVFGKVCE